MGLGGNMTQSSIDDLLQRISILKKSGERRR